MSAPRYDQVSVGEELPGFQVRLLRADLVRYAGASGDFNPIHWNERIAHEVGLPDVLAHGMLTMGQAMRIASDWACDPGAVVECAVKFTRPVVVPDTEEGAVLEVSASVAEKLDDHRVRLAITASSQGQSVLGRAHAVVRLT